MQEARDMTDEEILRRGYQALLEKLGPVGFIRFVWQHKPPEGDYLAVQDKIFEGMTVEEIYDEAVRLEAKRKEERGES